MQISRILHQPAQLLVDYHVEICVGGCDDVEYAMRQRVEALELNRTIDRTIMNTFSSATPTIGLG